MDHTKEELASARERMTRMAMAVHEGHAASCDGSCFANWEIRTRAAARVIVDGDRKIAGLKKELDDVLAAIREYATACDERAAEIVTETDAIAALADAGKKDAAIARLETLSSGAKHDRKQSAIKVLHAIAKAGV